MLEIVLYWCSKGVDGFRCDMVEMVPWQFMKWLIEKVKASYPGVIFIAEVYQKDLYRRYVEEVGFDLLYDKSGLYDTLRSVVQGGGTARAITWNWQSLGDLQPRMLNFLENHDEQRFASDFFAMDASKAAAPLCVSLLLNDSAFMIYNGQEAGERGVMIERNYEYSNGAMPPILYRGHCYSRAVGVEFNPKSGWWIKYADQGGCYSLTRDHLWPSTTEDNIKVCTNQDREPSIFKVHEMIKE